MDFLIRKMLITDISQVQDVAMKSWNATYDGIIPLEMQNNFLESAYNDEMMKKRVQHSFILVAEVNGMIVGFSNFSQVSHGKADLSAIYLYPEYQGKGIGTALLYIGIENLDSAREIYIDVEKENSIGRTFYEAKGFEVVKEFDDNFDGHILQTIRMVLKV
ncbi:GNAT family N-acetyltransferase [Oceanobacillus bengalensis]|uniref:N-acetyltransferase n=1 Tax=Oceanobacillus bengalensis TaxID=1435466 RepID=A0A494Z5P1_9BACI|nr:N-acetyltransferase [Oceanobacillus bengalensis]RKQ17636.1 N-acetyltransferase [Oceanobacillus bengalensis]